VLTNSSYFRPHFVRWSKVRTTYDTYANEELSVSGSEASDDDFVDMNAKDMIDYDMTVFCLNLSSKPVNFAMF
jgi:RNA polymerase I-specific transcription initiation factor RRN3